ncbi:MAG: efflux RND transporter periplasmic adaptor subunit [Deltaproteobacteria bacterium]|nr:efflux RND transporter periplasmic adaptor subunit [Deltaproteobacteria bacterium]
MSSKFRSLGLAGALVFILSVSGLHLFKDVQDQVSPVSGKLPVPVEVAEVQRGPLACKRVFSGTIEPFAQCRVAAKVSGRVARLLVEVADPVHRGQLLARLDDSEARQGVAEAQARLAVAEADSGAAQSRLRIAQRELSRNQALHQRGIASDSARDTAEAEFLNSQAAVKVAAATLKQEAAALAAAEIRLEYTRVKAEWDQGDDDRIVAERFVDEGSTIAANGALFSIVELDVVVAVIEVSEKDYAKIVLGEPATLTTDAFPGKIFTGSVQRIAPVFQPATRQARIEILVPNPELLLKPGMFGRCTLVLEQVADALSVPETALCRRRQQTGVFLLDEKGTTVKWVEVEPGIQDGERVQLLDSKLSGRVVTLGQQLIKDGSLISVVASPTPETGGRKLQ